MYLQVINKTNRPDAFTALIRSGIVKGLNTSQIFIIYIFHIIETSSKQYKQKSKQWKRVKNIYIKNDGFPHYYICIKKLFHLFLTEV